MNNFKSTSLALLLSSQLALADDDPFDLDFEDLLGIEVTSVSKQSQPLSNAPAAIYVITNEDIIRSGATSIPQALRGVPGLHIAQIDSQKWSVSSRGFNGRYNNKLLVMMDGRTLYSPLFSGTYWETQDTLMADIERIEIIRGPSAAMWGANAVNGVINITTKHSSDTLGGYVELGAGDYERAFSGFRYGGNLTDNTTARVYAKGFKRDSLKYNHDDMNAFSRMLMSNIDDDNDWHNIQAGSRIDMQIDPSATLALTADIYNSNMKHLTQTASLTPPFYSEIVSDSFDSRGWNIVAKYTKALSASSEYSLQAYYDYARREDDLFGFTTDTLDIDFQHQFIMGEKHNLVWGVAYRHIADELTSQSVISTSTEKSTHTNLWSAFVRDEITLIDDTLWLTLASRFEHNSYTDVEVQPNVRLMWKLNDQHKLWSSIAYAVRTPSRSENNFNINTVNIPPSPLPTPLTQVVLKGGSNYESEELLSYELGYRFTLSNTFSFDSALFYNDYDELRGITTGEPDISTIGSGYISQPFLIANNQDGYNYGFELSTQWLATKDLNFKINYAYTQSHFNDEGLGQGQNTDAPKHIVTTQADWAITKSINADLTWRYVDDVELISPTEFYDLEVDSYHGVDIGLHWQVTPAVIIEAYGKNLLNSSHIEYVSEVFQLPNRVEPSYYGKVTLSF